jgi:hypothetical protein
MDLLSPERQLLLIRYLRKLSKLETSISDETMTTTRGKDSLICTNDGLHQRSLLTADPFGEVSEERTYVYSKMYVTS